MNGYRALWIVAAGVGVCCGLAQPGRGGEAGAQSGKLSDETLGQVIRQRELWQNNRLGITDQVPPPWTPMTAQGQRVGCWGRSYDFSGSLLPKSIRAQGEEILAAPVSLRLRSGDRKVVTVQAADQQSIAAAAPQVDLTASAAAAGLRVQVKTHLEYDGCAKIELSLIAEKPVLLDALELVVPLKPERSLYYHWFEATRDPKLTNAGALPAAGLAAHFKPLVWLGDDDRGLAWFCESPKGWPIARPETVIRVERGAEATRLRVRMADRPWVVAGTWRVVFGLMATPVRPMPPGWRDWLIGLNQSNPWSSWAPGFNNQSGTDDPGTLWPQDPAAMRRWVDQAHHEGWPVPYLPLREPAKVIPYSQIVFWSGKDRDGRPSPEIKLFGPEWSYTDHLPGPRREPERDIPAKEYYWVCPESSFAQFYIYELDRLIDQVNIDGIYIDGPWNTCGNRLHGCGYADDRGQWQTEYKIWPYRELLKRMYCLFYQKRKAPVIHHHTSCWLCIPCLSFCHMMLDGEQYHDVGQKVEAHFLDVVPLDKWRAEHTGRQWGPAPFLLPDIPSQYCRAEAATRELLLLTNLHDTGLFPAGNNMRTVMRNYQARRLFGVADCEFRGYWARPAWAACDTPEAHVSLYRKPDGSRCLLVVGNTARGPATVRLRPDFARLQLAGGPVRAGVDLETGRRVPIVEGEMAVDVKGRDYRLIALPDYDAPPITAGDMRASALKTVPNPGFEEGLSRWTTSLMEGNTGTVEVDRQVKYSGQASCRLHKAEGPGGVMVQTEDVFAVDPAKKYRVTCQVKIAKATGAKAYWMVAPVDGEGHPTATNNIFSGFLTANQDWKAMPLEFQPPPGTAVVRLHFLVAFPGAADVWIDDVRLETAF
jgi:hypothetical protein